MEKAIKRTTIDYCASGKQYRKSTDIWTSFDWTPNGSTGNGKCNNGQCGMGTENTKGRFMHHLCIAGASGRQLKGKNVKQQLWSVPNDLTLEVMRWCSRARKEHKQSAGLAIRSDSQLAQATQLAQPVQSAQNSAHCILSAHCMAPDLRAVLKPLHAPSSRRFLAARVCLRISVRVTPSARVTCMAGSVTCCTRTRTELITGEHSFTAR
jgi:hypothetical protein